MTTPTPSPHPNEGSQGEKRRSEADVQHTLPSERATLPSESAAIPSESAALPSEQANIPSQSWQLPSESTALPSEQAAVPSEQARIGSESAAVPSEQAEIASQGAEVASEQAAIPSQSAAVPSEQAGIPSQDAPVTSEQAAIPSQDAALPSEQAAIPSEQATLPSERYLGGTAATADTHPGGGATAKPKRQAATQLPLPAPQGPHAPPFASTVASATSPASEPPAPPWLVAMRPRTLPAAATPVIIGVTLAVADGIFAWLPALACLVCALLLQVAANFANDYFDHKKGADTAQRLGPPRATSSGWLTPQAVLRATFATLALAVALGAYLVYVGGTPILVIGLAGIAAVLLYTGGPKPLGYMGLGDLFVFLFFGFAAVGGTYFVQAAAHGLPSATAWVPGTVWLAAVPAGCLVTAILVVNNLRDRVTDAAAHKRTLAVLIGPRATRVEFAALLCVAYAVPVVVLAAGLGPWGWLAPLLTLPLAALRMARVWQLDGKALNPELGATAKLGLWYALLLFAGLVVLPPVLELAGIPSAAAASRGGAG